MIRYCLKFGPKLHKLGKDLTPVTYIQMVKGTDFGCHSPTRQVLAICNPDQSSIWMVTVLTLWYFLVDKISVFKMAVKFDFFWFLKLAGKFEFFTFLESFAVSFNERFLNLEIETK